MKRLLINHKKIPSSSNRFDLTRCLFSSGSFIGAKEFSNKFKQGLNEVPNHNRYELIESIIEAIETRLTMGGSLKTTTGSIHAITGFFQFLETKKLSFSLKDLKSNYFEYCEYLFQTSSQKNARISNDTAYQYAASLSSLFGKVLGIPVQGSLVKQTRLSQKKKRKKAVSKDSEKQNLEDTFVLGAFLNELIQAIDSESVLGPQPIVKKIESNSVKCEFISISKGDSHAIKKELLTKSVSKIQQGGRWALFNLRMQAEIMMFAAQTGMNPSQIYSLKRQQLDFKPLGEDYEVRSYKNRKGGQVLFKVFKSYKSMLQKHFEFIDEFASDSNLLFPYFKQSGKGFREFYGNFGMLKDTLNEHNIPWIPPSRLRNTRTNWLLRRSGDEGLTSKIAQHTQKTLRDKYELPSQQRAMVEITQFWNKHDSIEQTKLKKSVIASECNGIPEPILGIPEDVVEPNCINPSGCLWCKHHRDLDNFDYIWSLTSMRYLKTIEAALTFKKDETPADLSIQRLTQKLDWYSKSSKKRNEWVEEAELRIEEGSYHPSWSSIIEFLE